MNFKEAVDAIDGRVKGWVDAYKQQAADSAAADYRADLVKQHTSSGVLLAPVDRLDAAEEAWRRDRDRQADADGRAVDLDVDLLAARLEAEVAACEPLQSLSSRYGVNTERGLTALLVDSVRERNIRDDVRGLSYGELEALYAGLRDDADADNAAIRIIEDAVLHGRLDQLQLIEGDSMGIAIGIHRLQAAVKARRTARVPEPVRLAAAKLATVRSVRFAEMLGHLKAGRGIAHRPRSLQTV